MVPILQTLMEDTFGLSGDAEVEAKKATQNATDPYPVGLFRYLVSKAPAIGGLS
jgi:hypothetical protein